MRHAPGPFMLILAGLVASQAHGQGTAAIRDLGSRRELMIDRYLVERLQGTTLALQTPRPAGVAFKYERPWEELYGFYTTVLKDGDRYLMYYRGYFGSAINKGEGTGFAESRDGIHWTRPSLGIFEFEGSRDNNMILPAGHQFTAFIDGRPGVPASERFKGNHEGKGGLIGWVSGDGIHWKQVQERAIVPRSLENHFDSQNVMFWSEAEQCYVLYARHAVGKRRAHARATSKDFIHWTAPTLMTYSDTGTTVPSQHLYTNQTHPYFRAPHIYIALPGRFQAGRRVLTEEQARAIDAGEGGGGASDIADGVLLTSRAGTSTYDCTFLESFVRPGIGYSNWTSRNNYPALGVVQTGPAEMSLYVQRNYGQRNAYLERMTLRLDGFASVHAPYQGGEMVTRPFRFTGKELEINYATSAAGGLRVEIQDASGKALPGFALADCPEIVGDEIERVVRWRAGSEVGALAGKTVRLRFSMKDADLFSLRFRP